MKHNDNKFDNTAPAGVAELGDALDSGSSKSRVPLSAPIDFEDAAEKQLIAEFFGNRDNGFFVEVGANDPFGGSQTYHLETKGWNGILIEPQSSFYKRLTEHRMGSTIIQAGCTAPEKVGEGVLHIPELDGFATLEKNVDDLEVQYTKSETVALKTLDTILEETGVKEIDFVSIDVEGTELDVLKGFDLKKWRPKLVLIEDKLHDLTKHNYLVSMGYKLAKRTCMNDWYVPKEMEFKLTSAKEKIKLFRKVFLGLPFRKFRRWKKLRKTAA